MFTDQTLIIINVTSIILLVVLMLVLIAATRMKGGAGWAALVSVATTVPAYLSNLMRDLGSEYFLWVMYPAITLNVICFPALWFFVRSQYDKSFRFEWRDLLHFLPAIISLSASIIYYTPLSAEQVAAEMEYISAGEENLPAIINDVLVFGQFFIYFIAMFFYIRKRRRYLRDNFSNSDYLTLRWIPNFLILFFALFFVIAVAYIIAPRTDAWLIPILNSIVLVYLVYNIIFHSTQPYINRIPAEKNEREKVDGQSLMSEAEMKGVCDKVVEYLIISRAYINPDFSLSTLSSEVGIHQKNISTAINGYLHNNFFELVNGMRVEEAKRLLLSSDREHYTVESVYADCGFRSRSTFFLAFKKVEGKPPAQWLKENSIPLS